MADTIFATSTAPGRAGVAVIRISGPDAFASLRSIAGRLPAPRRAELCSLCDPATGEKIDEAIVLRFDGPRSFTGEDVVELQTHGSVAVGRAVERALSDMAGFRRAEPGEFTRRALLSGRLDLAQVEGLADLLAAETTAQRRQAINLMDGALSRLAAGWRDALVRSLAYIEAGIDFSDEDLPDGLLAQVTERLEALRSAVTQEINGSQAAERVREGFEVALVGAPNTGKSTLLNLLAGRDAAITSEVAGTTRDVIEVRMEIRGLPVTLLDLAGLRSTGDFIESIGIDRSRSRAASSDLRIFLLEKDGSHGSLGVAQQPGDIVLGSKADLLSQPGGDAVSGITGYGVERMLEGVAGELSGRVAAAGTIASERQKVVAVEVSRALGEAIRHLQPEHLQPEIAAEEIHRALGSIDFLAGKVDVESVLSEIFASFCLGK